VKRSLLETHLPPCAILPVALGLWRLPAVDDVLHAMRVARVVAGPVGRGVAPKALLGGRGAAPHDGAVRVQVGEDAVGLTSAQTARGRGRQLVLAADE